MISTKTELNNLLSSPLTIGIALILIGILFCALRAGFISILLTIAGVFLIVFGILNLIGKRNTVGAIELAVGAIVIICGWTIVDVALLIFGIILVAYAIYQVFTSIPMLKKSKPKDIIMSLVYPLLTLALGVILIVARWKMIDALFIVIGVMAIVYGIILITKNLIGDKKITASESSTNNK